MIKPTPGRIVLFKRGDTRPGEELAAIVCKVWNDCMVNLAVFDANGHPTSHTSVRLLQDDERPHGEGSWCEWMPYQKGQAFKAEMEAERVSAEAKADAAALDVSALANGHPSPCAHAAIERSYLTAAGGFRCVDCGATAERVSDFDTDRRPRLPAGTRMAEGYTMTGPEEPIGR